MGTIYSNSASSTFERMKYLVDNKMLPTDQPFAVREASYGSIFLVGHIYGNYQFGEFLSLGHSDGESYICQIDLGIFRMKRITTEDF